MAFSVVKMTASMCMTLMLTAAPSSGAWPEWDVWWGRWRANDASPPRFSQKERLAVASRPRRPSGMNRCSCDREFKMVEGRTRETEEKLTKLQNDMNKANEAVRRMKTSGGTAVMGPMGQIPNIAFTARVAYSRPHLTETETIVFDELVINNGDAYDPITGIFNSPVAGLYRFQTTILSGHDTAIETMIVKNGDEVARVYSGGFKSRGSGTNAVLLNLEADDEVWVSVFYGNGDYVHGLWSTFSGHLLAMYTV